MTSISLCAAFATGTAVTCVILRMRMRQIEQPTRTTTSSATADNDSLFERAARAAVSGAPRLSQAQRADLYRHYKQATEGPCNTDPPPLYDFVARAKYDAWASLGDMPAANAAARYVALVDELTGTDWRLMEPVPPRDDYTDVGEDDEAEDDDGSGASGGLFAMSRPLVDSHTDSDKTGDIFIACQTGDAEGVACLLSTEAGKALVHRRNSVQETPLHAAADGGHVSVVQLLLAADAVVNAVEDNGQTALDYAVALGHDDAAALLRQHARAAATA